MSIGFLGAICYNNSMYNYVIMRYFTPKADNQQKIYEASILFLEHFAELLMRKTKTAVKTIGENRLSHNNITNKSSGPTAPVI